jgi:hypothetical protein
MSVKSFVVLNPARGEESRRDGIFQPFPCRKQLLVRETLRCTQSDMLSSVTTMCHSEPLQGVKNFEEDSNFPSVSLPQKIACSRDPSQRSFRI